MKHQLSTTLPENVLKQALMRLQQGEPVAIPTETVYGLAADARRDDAIKRVFALKGRPAHNPLIIHVGSIEQAEKIAYFTDLDRAIAAHFWPGPLTLILRMRPQTGISPFVTAGLDTAAIRIPAHPVMRHILNAFDGPLAAPSANKSGTLSPTTPTHVQESFGADAPYIIPGGASSYGVESTILDLSQAPATILRPGPIGPDDFAAFLNPLPALHVPDANDGTAPRSPGLLLRHYAPRTPLRLRAIDIEPDEGLLAFGSTQFMGIRGGGHLNTLPPNHIWNLSADGDLEEAAANLYRALHDLDAQDLRKIAVMDIPNSGIGIAIGERLAKAAKSSRDD